MNKIRLGSALTFAASVLVLAAPAGAQEGGAPPEPQIATAAPTPEPTAAPTPEPKAAAVEPGGGYGLFGGVTEDDFQFGPIVTTRRFEAMVTAEGAYAPKDSASSDSAASAHVGGRIYLGKLNYLALGAYGHVPMFGREDHISTFGSFRVGPYVSFERRFAGTPLMIKLWVLPYAVEYHVGSDGQGGQDTSISHHFFQSGGFGLAWLFKEI